MKLEDDVSRGSTADVAHPMGFAGGIEDHVVRRGAASDRLDLSFEKDDGDVVCIQMRFVAVAGPEDGDVRMELPKVLRGTFEQHPGVTSRLETTE